METIKNSNQKEKNINVIAGHGAVQKYETDFDDYAKETIDDLADLEALLEPALPEKLQPKRILVIDDEPSVRNLLANLLKKAGYETVMAANGKEGRQLFMETPSDLIITDIVMPEMSGHEFIIDLKKEYPDVKIIAISGNQYVGPEIELSIAEAFGAVKVFAKPFKASEILHAVKTLLQLKYGENHALVRKTKKKWQIQD